MGGSFLKNNLLPTFKAHYDYALGRKFGEPLNGQHGRQAVVTELVRHCGFQQIVETGTSRGASTEWFSQFGLPVYSVEIDPRAVHFSRLRLRKNTLIHLAVGDSVAFLRSFVRDPERRVPTLFYLDAHWEERLPLREEVEIISASYPSAVIMIDDFAVPDDPGYGYDDYGSDKRLDLDYLPKDIRSKFVALFPQLASANESGARRGCVVLATIDMFERLKGADSLRQLPDRQIDR
jgi:predicted O-methyltransferase YrrM